jgi:hypothetical protein
MSAGSVQAGGRGESIPMAGRRDEVQQYVYTVVTEPRVTLNTRFLCENAVVLSLEVADDFRETA